MSTTKPGLSSIVPNPTPDLDPLAQETKLLIKKMEQAVTLAPHIRSVMDAFKSNGFNTDNSLHLTTTVLVQAIQSLQS